jgi:hypothetical protein
VGETRVDLQHLLEALRGAYSGALEQTILTEVVANTLDSSATRLAMTAPVGTRAIAARTPPPRAIWPDGVDDGLPPAAARVTNRAYGIRPRR